MAGKLAFFARVLCLVLVLFVLSGMAGVPMVPQRLDIVTPLVLDAHAQDRARDVLENVPEAVEKRIRELLVPVYGEEHVVVRASLAPARDSKGALGDGRESRGMEGQGMDGQGRSPIARPPVSVAVIIDAGVLPAAPTSPESMKAEQDRLSNLLVHAAGLDLAHGDSLAASFLLFTRDSRAVPWWALAGFAFLALVLVGLLVFCGLSRRRENDGHEEKSVNNLTQDVPQPSPAPTPQNVPERLDRPLPDEGKTPSWETGNSREALARLADRLRVERPQARAVALSLLDPKDTALALAALPVDLGAETLACMVLQEHVEDEVLDFVGKMLLDGVERAKMREKDPVVRTLKVLDALDSLDSLDSLGSLGSLDASNAFSRSRPGEHRERLLAEMARMSPEAGQMLDVSRA